MKENCYESPKVEIVETIVEVNSDCTTPIL